MSHWKAGCRESGLSCLGRGRRKRATSRSTSPAAYSTLRGRGGGNVTSLPGVNRVKDCALWVEPSSATELICRQPLVCEMRRLLEQRYKRQRGLKYYGRASPRTVLRCGCNDDEGLG